MLQGSHFSMLGIASQLWVVSSEESWGSSSTLHWQIYQVVLPQE
jgi:hypothetical protein